MRYFEESIESLYSQFGSSEKGLSDSHVEELRRIHGSNVLQREEKDSWIVILLRQFHGLLIYILVAAAVISGLLGETTDMWVIIAILILNGVIGFVQEYRAQASIEALKKMASAKAVVVRNGREQTVDASELVPGDIILLQTGDRVPADARLIEAVVMDAQEAALTGESTPVGKHTKALEGELTLGDQKNMVFSGTVITKGRGKALIVATGMQSEIGKIAHLIQESEVEDTPLQKELDRMGGKIGQVTLIICFIIFGIMAWLNGGFSLDALREPFLLSVSLAVAAIPEGLPIVVTIALAFGTKRMISKNALIKRLASVETLGSTTVICSDKTGTLTKNEMTVTKIYFGGESGDVEGTGYNPQGTIDINAPRVLYEVMALCNDAKLLQEKNTWTIIGDPTEACLLTVARKAGYDEKHLAQEYPRVGEIPFSSERKRMTTIHEHEGKRVALTKGAPDVILNHCTRILEKDTIRDLTEEDKKRILAQNEEYAKQALRVLGFAFRAAPQEDTYDEHLEQELIFIGLAGMIDPPRTEVRDAVATCHKAGIRVVMITGDHKTTAVAIAKELGIVGKAIEGKDLDDINLDDQVGDIAVYARVNPEDKMRIVEALKKQGEIVAMTGDGVNDAPALKRADIGIAMGITGTDVAKESAAMILLDDNFSSIVSAVEEGRNIYTNIKKFVNYLLSSNFAEVLVVLLSVLWFSQDGGTIVALTASMILFMNLVTDSLPALALGVDPGNPDIMTRKPRSPKEHVISKNMTFNIVFIGVLVAAATLLTFKLALPKGVVYAQTIALTTLVILEIVRLTMIRSQYKTPALSNKWLVLAIAFVLSLQVAVVYWKPLQSIFNTVALHPTDWAIMVLVSAATYIIGQLIFKLAVHLTGQHD